MEFIRTYLPPSDVDTVVYHAGCSDGFGGAYNFWKLSNRLYNHHLIEYIPYSHSDSEEYIKTKIFPLLKNKNVVFIDVCPKYIKEMMVELPARAIVLDHHESAFTILNDVDESIAKRCYIDMTHSGAVLGHMFCFPNEQVPLFLECIEDRDLWAWKIADVSKPFIEYFYSYVPFEFEEYAKFENTVFVSHSVDEGKVLLKYKDYRVKQLAKRAAEKSISIDGQIYNVFVINCGEYISDLGNELSKRKLFSDKLCDFVILWNYDHKKETFIVSLRSDNEREDATNVRKISEYFGGGGHQNAAGFCIHRKGLLFNELAEILNTNSNTPSKFLSSSLHSLLPYISITSLVAVSLFGTYKYFTSKM